MYGVLYTDFLSMKMKEKSKFDFLENFRQNNETFTQKVIEEMFFFASTQQKFAGKIDKNLLNIVSFIELIHKEGHF